METRNRKGIDFEKSSFLPFQPSPRNWPGPCLPSLPGLACLVAHSAPFPSSCARLLLAGVAQLVPRPARSSPQCRVVHSLLPLAATWVPPVSTAPPSLSFLPRMPFLSCSRQWRGHARQATTPSLLQGKRPISPASCFLSFYRASPHL